MKKIAIMILLLFSSALFAQEETLLGQDEFTSGGFGAPVVKFTSINDQFAVLVGARGGWIINHSFIIGGGGYGLVNEVNGVQMINGKKMLLNFGYGGFEMEYIMNWEKIAHGSVYVLMGGGGISHRDKFTQWEWGNNTDSLDTFFIVEPSVNLEVNIVSFFRINVGASYRFISGVGDTELTNKKIAGLSAQLTLKFGSF